MNDIVYVVQKNADWAEGRGPMVMKGIFRTEAEADEYINSHSSGIFGAKPPEGMSLAEWCKSGRDGGWGGFDVIPVDLELPTQVRNIMRKDLTK